MDQENDRHHDDRHVRQARRDLGVVPIDDPLLDQPCILLGLPDEAAYVREIVERLRLAADRARDLFRPTIGLGLTAPQIGITRTAALIRLPAGTEIVLLNPRVVDASVEETAQYETCPSIPDVEALVSRPTCLVVEHQEIDGELRTTRFATATAHLVGHAIDHLLGVPHPARRRRGVRADPTSRSGQLSDDLPARVLRWARTMPGMRDPVRLLAASPWLADRRFVQTCVVALDDEHPPLALVDWAAVRGFLMARPEGDAEDLGTLHLAYELATEAWASR